MKNTVFNTYQSDDDRNRIYQLINLLSGKKDSLRYIDGVLHQNRTPVTDKKLIESQEQMFKELSEQSKVLSNNNKF